MSKENFSKVRTLLLWELLNKRTDDEHMLTRKEIIDCLDDMGIKCDRRTFKDDIDALNETGHEVMVHSDEKENKYSVVSHLFNSSELRVLMDAVRAATFIDSKLTTLLIKKLASLWSDYKVEQVESEQDNLFLLLHINNVKKHSNDKILYSVETIEQAITEKKQISFKYFKHDYNGNRVFRNGDNNGRHYFNPVATALTNENYYLIGFFSDNAEEICLYRIDRMTEVKVEDATYETPEVITQKIDELCSQAFFMFKGDASNVTIEIDKSLIDTVIDNFGEDIKFTPNGDKLRFNVRVQLSNMFFGWCLSFGSSLKIISPDNVKSKMLAYVREVSSLYN